MSKMSKKLKRTKELKKRKEERKQYKDGRDIGPCFLKEEQGCQSNGDLTTHCKMCDFTVQSCTEHHPAGRAIAKRHVIAKHPVTSLPTLALGAIRGDSFE